MSDRLLVDLAADELVSVSTWLEGERPSRAEGRAADLVWPLRDDALEDLRWYLEDYLRAPFGVYQGRGPEVAARLAAWGDEIFAAVFGSGPARDAYQRIQAHSGLPEVIFRSASAELLAMPWELMRDPTSGQPIALAAGMNRSLATAELGSTLEAPGRRLRVLMVSSRPAGAGDVGFQMVTPPLLARLEAVRGNVDLVVLRPPTLEALVETLTSAVKHNEPFQVVHFDGHGALGSPYPSGSDVAKKYAGRVPDGVLVLQGQRGEANPVPSSTIAQVLAQGKVPIAVINACQSGAVGKDLEAAVATRFLREGVSSVVAMAYSVDAVAAAEFMATFYEQLFAADTVSAAVSAGRRHLYRHDRRPSPKGETPLADWLVPVHYMQREVRFPRLVTSRPAHEPSLEAELSRLRRPAQDEAGGALAPEGVFIGRDALIYELDTAAQFERVIILHGPAGIGKTELAKAFGRWWRDTGGLERPERVFWHSFEPGLASFRLDGVVTEIGATVFGSDFARLDDDQRKSVVTEFLRTNRALLIWDSFETAHSMPDPTGATPPLEAAECQQVKEFLAALTAKGKSTVIITSRTSEDWLDHVRRFSVDGLLPAEAAKYADALLSPYPAAAPRRANRAFGELIEWLDGHPLSMRLVLPRLRTTDPQALLAGLRGTAPLPGLGQAEPDHATSLRASLDQSFTALNPETRRLMVVACLFQGTADADVLAVFSVVDGVPEQFRGINREAWAAALDAAAAAGLMTSLGGGMYRIHPALPSYLAALWRREEPDYEQERAAAIRALLSAYAAFGAWLDRQIDSGTSNLAYTVISLHQRTMSYLLGFALDGKDWTRAQAIAQPLNDYWDEKDQYAEADMWTERVRLAVEDTNGIVPDLESPAGELWLFFVGSQAYRQVTTGQFDAAERNYRQIEGMLLALPASSMQQSRLAVTRHRLGMVARDRGRLGEAEDWYRKSLAISEDLGDRPGIATSYHQLGMVALNRGRLGEAEDWYRKSLAIDEDLGDRPGIATSYHQLGLVALNRGRLGEAEDWYRKSLAIDEELGDQPGLADSYYQLGRLARERGQLDDAESWYRRSLVLREELGDRYGLANSYYQLGNVAYLRRRLDEAAEWYTRSLAVEEEIGNRLGRARSYDMLGAVAREGGQLDDARNWYRRSLVIREELGDRYGLANSYYLLGIVAQRQGRLEEAEDWYTKSLAIHKDLGDQPGLANAYGQLGLLAEERGQLHQALEWTVRCVTQFGQFPHPMTGPGPDHLARLTARLGMPALEVTWQRVADGPLPETVRDYISTHQPTTGAQDHG